MRWLVGFGWLAVCLVAFAGGRGTILVVGDSLSAAHGMEPRQGWVALLEQRLRDRRLDYTVVNASISGDTTASGRARLPRLLQTHKPAVVVIELGGNDGLRGLPLEQVKKNLQAMVAEARRHGARVLLVGVPLPPNYGPRYTEQFGRLYAQVAHAQQVALLPSLLEGVGADRALMQTDGIHPNAGAQPRMLENLWAVLAPLL
jgi:acyl-CoA thioesterase-1